MFGSMKHYINSEKGFALIAAIIACVILLALGALVVALSTGDIKTSSRVVGDKRSMAAAEKGIHRMMQNFDPANFASGVQTTVSEDLAVDAHSQYEIGVPVATGSRPMVGYDQTWGLTTFNVNVMGQNTIYDTRVIIGVGLGYGPGDISLVYK